MHPQATTSRAVSVKVAIVVIQIFLSSAEREARKKHLSKDTPLLESFLCSLTLESAKSHSEKKIICPKTPPSHYSHFFYLNDLQAADDQQVCWSMNHSLSRLLCAP